MTGLAFEALRAANATRHVRYFGGKVTWSHDDWIIALGGETGEALNVVKKMNRDRLGMLGNDRGWDELVAKLGDELADVVIYLDILAAHFRTRRLGAASPFTVADFGRLRDLTIEDYKFEPPSLAVLSSAGRHLFRVSGRLADLVPASNAQFAEQCDWVLSAADQLAYNATIDLGAAVVRKFNATSDKLGFPERLGA